MGKSSCGTSTVIRGNLHNNRNLRKYLKKGDYNKYRKYCRHIKRYKFLTER